MGGDSESASKIHLIRFHITMCLRVLRDALVSRATASERAMVRAIIRSLLTLKALIFGGSAITSYLQPLAKHFKRKQSVTGFFEET